MKFNTTEPDRAARHFATAPKDLQLAGKRVILSPGRNITAEITTGHWRII